MMIISNLCTCLKKKSCCGVVVFALLNLVWLNFANRRKKTKGQKTVEDLQKSDDEVVDPLLSKMGDRHPDFKYAY